MRAIHLVRLDKIRPAVLLTRYVAIPYLSMITVAPITSSVRGIATEVPVSPAHGLDHDHVIHLDTITTVPSEHVGAFVGLLGPHDEALLVQAVLAAFGFALPPTRAARTSG